MTVVFKMTLQRILPNAVSERLGFTINRKKHTFKVKQKLSKLFRKEIPVVGN